MNATPAATPSPRRRPGPKLLFRPAPRKLRPCLHRGDAAKGESA